MTRAFVKPELLAPAGNMEKGKMALLYGADAIYLGGKMFGLRAFANNFDLPEIAEIAAYAHSLGKKVYVTVNIFAHSTNVKQSPSECPEACLVLPLEAADWASRASRPFVLSL